jgi:hypothetical protein
MPEIGDWLQKLGLGQYAQRFAENDITFGILPHLTDQDLKELGVSSLGHRRQLLLSIAELKGGEAGSPKPATEDIAPVTAHDTAERRQVTVMFSDLVGSTALSARMDPEDLREVISAYQKCVAETVQRFGGFVAKYMGDGVLIYFGYPQAHEDDAERAVRAGLELVTAVGALWSHNDANRPAEAASISPILQATPDRHGHIPDQKVISRRYQPLLPAQRPRLAVIP